jgi:hypothetical protein
MAKVSLKCSSCNGVNHIDDTNLLSFKCKYCGIDNVVSNGIVSVNDNSSDSLPKDLDFEIRLKNAKYTLNTLKLYDKAYEMYKELYKTYDTNPDVLEGLMISLTHNFNHKSVTDFDIDEDIEFNNYLRKYELSQKKMNKVISFYKKYRHFLPLAKQNSVINDLDKSVEHIKYVLFLVFSVIGFIGMLIFFVVRRWIEWNL